MKAYHMSETLKVGDTLEVNHQNLINFVEPFVQALEKSEECYYGMILQSKYMCAVLDKLDLREWSDYVKWSTEGAFEFIRKTEFPKAISRLRCNYFFDNLKDVKRLYADDWGNEPEEIQNNIHLFEIELNDESIQKFDMSIFDQAYSAMEEHQDVQAVLNYARNYFAGNHTEKPIWEILTNKNIKITNDITTLLR